MDAGRELDALVAEKVMGWCDFWRSGPFLCRACELLAADGNLTPLDDMPRTTPGERVPVSDYATVPPEVDRWRRTQRRNEDV